MGLLGKALIVAVVLAAALLLGIRWLEPRMVFHPIRYPVGDWDVPGRDATVVDVELTTTDGVRLHGWWMPAADPAAPVLLWCHGNAGNLTHRYPHAEVLRSRGFGVLLFDYRGYGRSDGLPSEEGLVLDAEAAHAWLTGEAGVPASRIVLLGRSLGSFAAARLATSHPHAGLVLVSPFPSAEAMSRVAFGLPLSRLGRVRLEVAAAAATRTTPLLIIHGARDRIVPLRLGREVFDAAPGPKRFVELPDAGHNDILATGGERYLGAIVDFARQVTPR